MSGDPERSNVHDETEFDEVLGVLARDVHVRLLNVSGSGCLVESTRRVDVGMSAALRLRFEGAEYGDDVIVRRCDEMPGAGATYHVGAEFTWTTPPGVRSLRRMAVRLQRLAGRPRVSEGADLRPAM